MPPIDSARASWTPRIFTRDVLPTIRDELLARFGADALKEGDPANHLAEMLNALPFDDMEQDLLDVIEQANPFSATGEFLEAAVWPYEVLGAKAAAGAAELNWKAIPTTPTPFFATSDITFVGANGLEYVPTEAINPPADAFDSTTTGAVSQTIDDTTRTKIAQKFSIATDETFIQAVRFTMNHVSGTPEVTVSVFDDDDTNGQPASSQPSADLLVSGETPADGTEHTAFFASGAYLDAGDYWLVIEVTTGSGTFDGGTGGTSDQVKSLASGTWSLDSNVENLTLSVVEGGVIPVQCSQVGQAGNLDPGRLTDVRLNTTAAQTRYDTYVGSFENELDIEGGRNLETPAETTNRVRRERSARPTSSPDGLAKALKLFVPGVLDAAVEENTTDTGGATETPYDGSADTGTASSTIDGTTPWIAQKFQVTQRSFVQHAALTLDSDTGLVGNVRIESDDGGDPGGIIATGVISSDYTPGGTSRTVVTFDKGVQLETGTDYWLTVERTAGSATFDGETASGDEDVKNSTDGSTWAVDAAVDNLNVEVIGGVPNKGGRAIVRGGAAVEIAKLIREAKPLGAKMDGTVSGTFTSDVDDQQYTEYFARPTEVPVVIYVAADTTSDYPGGDSPIKNVLIEYVGGFDSFGTQHLGDGINGKVIRSEAIGRVQDDSRVVGVQDTTEFYLARKSNHATPDDAKTAGVTANLSATGGELFVIDSADDIKVVRTAVS